MEFRRDLDPGDYSPSATQRNAGPPATGAWRDGDPVAGRKFVDIGQLGLEFGGSLPAVRMAYETFGKLSPAADNAILLLHALTGDAHVIGPKCQGQATAGWWEFMVGPGKPIDTDKYFVVCPNVLGGCQGSTGPSSIAPDGVEWGSRFPFISIRDMAAASHAVGIKLGIDRWYAVLGASMGGMHALEWIVSYPDEVERAAIIAAPAATSADHIALNSLQIQIVTLDPEFRGGDYYDLPAGHSPGHGLSIARRLALTTYRSKKEFDTRFGRDNQSALSPLGERGRFAIESYLDYHGNSFTRRFDANSYVRLLAAINSHDIARNRSSITQALDKVKAKTLVVGINSDRLYQPSDQSIIASGLPNPLYSKSPEIIDSMYGHDAFLIEREPLSTWMRELLDSSPA